MIEKIANDICLPKKTLALDMIERGLLMGAYEFGFKERIQFPLFSPLSFYEENYDDIKLEYLVDFETSTNEYYVFNPEYRTLARETAYTQFDCVSNYDFHYHQTIVSFADPERLKVIEDRVVGLCTVNPTDEDDAWNQIKEAGRKCLRNVKTNGAIMHSGEGTSEKVIFYLDGHKVGFGKDERDKGFMSIHFSVNDIYEILNKKK